MGDKKETCGLTRKECEDLQKAIIDKSGGFIKFDMGGEQYASVFTCASCQMEQLLKNQQAVNTIRRILKDFNYRNVSKVCEEVADSGIIKMTPASPICPMRGGNIRVTGTCLIKTCPYHTKDIFFKNCLIVAAEHAKTEPLTNYQISKLLSIPISVVGEVEKTAYNLLRKQKLREAIKENRHWLRRRMVDDKVCVKCYKVHGRDNKGRGFAENPNTKQVVCETGECVSVPPYVMKIEEEYAEDFPVVFWAAQRLFNGDVYVISDLFDANVKSLRAYLARTGLSTSSKR